MKKSISLVLAVLLCITCFSVVGVAEENTVDNLINDIDTFLDLHEVFNDCESHWINDAELIANVNSGALSFDMTTEIITEGSNAAVFTKKADADCDIPIVVRSGSEWFLNAYDYLEFDIYLTDGFKVLEDTDQNWATFNFQSVWSNDIDIESVYKTDVTTGIAKDITMSLKVGEWNHVRIPLPQDNLSAFKQFVYRIGYGCLEGGMGESIVIDNFYFTATGGRELELADRDGLVRLKARYDALTEEEKALVTNYSVLETMLADMDALEQENDELVQRVIDMIDALPAPEDITEADEMDIVDAEIALSELEYSLKKQVTNQDKLKAARAALDGLGTLKGDVNGDQTVNARDALLVLQAAVNKATLTDAQKTVADLNADSIIDAKDALMILKIAVGK